MHLPHNIYNICNFVTSGGHFTKYCVCVGGGQRLSNFVAANFSPYSLAFGKRNGWLSKISPCTYSISLLKFCCIHMRSRAGPLADRDLCRVCHVTGSVPCHKLKVWIAKCQECFCLPVAGLFLFSTWRCIIRLIFETCHSITVVKKFVIISKISEIIVGVVFPIM